tara:strand:- start:283 stop:390 length:108 start_codon:yes stop_codon:yes gene_type:complete
VALNDALEVINDKLYIAHEVTINNIILNLLEEVED